MVKIFRRAIAFTVATAMTLACSSVTCFDFGLKTSAAGAGAISKTATYCSGGTPITSSCPGSPVLESTGITASGTCGTCGNTLVKDKYGCSVCIHTGYSSNYCYFCDGRGSGSYTHEPHLHVSGTSSCAHGRTDSHYYDTAYGYDGSSSTFYVYPCTVSYSNGLSQDSYMIGSQTAQDYALPGHSILIDFTGVPDGWQPKVTIDGGTPTALAANTTTYSYTMADQQVTINFGLVQQDPTASASGVNKTYGDATFSIITASGYSTTSDGANTYASSDTAVATVDTSGNVTIQKAGSCNITITTAATDKYNAKATVISLSVGQATPTLGTITGSAITYGQTLNSSTLSGSTSVPGTLAWSVPGTIPSVANSNSTEYAITFTPNDTTNYKTISGTAKLTINKATPTISSVQASAITYGKTLANSSVTGTASVSGNFTWVNTSIAPTVADSGVTSYNVLFTPTDSVNYNTKTTTCKLTVNKATPTMTQAQINAMSATGITYLQTLANSTITGTASVPGSFAWVNTGIAPTVADSNTTAYPVVFHPQDTANYNDLTGLTLKLTVSKATPTITTNPTATPITYLQSLADSRLQGGIASTSGNFVWADTNIYPVVADSNTTAYAVKFVPTDTGNYNEVTGLFAKLQVNKAVPPFPDDERNSITATDITYGQTLADSTVTGTASIVGRFEWLDSTIKPTVNDSGTTPYGVKFISENPNYTDRDDLSTTVIVHKAAPTITQEQIEALHASDITYLEDLSYSTITGEASIEGHFEWVYPDIVPTVADSDRTPYAIVFIPDDTDNYNNLEGLTLTVHVNKADPIITTEQAEALNASGIVYLQTLADSQIYGEASVTGTFEWVDNTIAPVVADSDITEYDVVFKPDDSDNYNDLTGLKLTLHVDKATPTMTQEQIDALSASSIHYEQTLGDSSITGTASTVGHFEWLDNSVQPTVADSNTTDYPIVFIPDDTDNFNNLTGVTCRLEVMKGTPSMTQIQLDNLSASPITYGQILSDSTLNGEASVLGYFDWADDTIAPTCADSEITPYDVIFYPTDTDNYNNLTGITCKIKVNRAVPVIPPADIEAIRASGIKYGQTLADSVLTGTTWLEGSFVWADDTIAPDITDSDVTLYGVTFKPVDTVNYADLENLLCSVHVDPADIIFPQEMIDSITATDIYYPQALACSTISGDSPVPGVFTWADALIVPSVIDSERTDYAVVFTPYDTARFNIVTDLSSKVKVHPGNVIIPPEELGSLKATGIVLGQTLEASHITAETSIAGVFRWDDTTIAPTLDDSDTTLYPCTFYPTDNVNWNNTSGFNITVHVSEPTPELTPEQRESIKASGIKYGQTLKDSTLTGESNVPGHFEWIDNTIMPSVSDSDTTPYGVKFIPDDTVTYNIISDLVTTVHVEPSHDIEITEDIIKGLHASDITEGQALSNSTITSEIKVEGTFSWVDPTIVPTLADSEVTEFEVKCVPYNPDAAVITGIPLKVKVVKKERPTPIIRPVKPTPPDNPVVEEVYKVEVAPVEGIELYANYSYAKAGTIISLSTMPFLVVHDERNDTETITSTAYSALDNAIEKPEGHYELDTLMYVAGSRETRINGMTFVMPKSDVVVRATTRYVRTQKEEEPVEPTEEPSEPTEPTDEPTEETGESTEPNDETLEVGDTPTEESSETIETGIVEPEIVETADTDEPGGVEPEEPILDDPIDVVHDNTPITDDDNSSGKDTTKPNKTNPDTGVDPALVSLGILLAAAVAVVFRKRK